MQDFRECVQKTRRLLKQFHSLQATLANLQDDLAALEQMAGLEQAAPISKYSDMPGGGTPELNSVESGAERHMQLEKQIAEKRKAVQSLELIVRKMTRAIGCMNEQNQRLIRGHYFEGASWDELGRECGYTEKWARTHGGEAVKLIASMLFGCTPEDDIQLSLNLLYIV